MSVQQINLYQPILRKQRKVLSARALVQATGLVLVSLIAIWGFARLQVAALEQELARARVQQAQSAERVAELKRLYPAPAPDPALERAVAAARKEVQTKQRLLEVLAQRRFGNTDGFVPHLEGLARQKLEGLWLTGLELRSGGTVLKLTGNALEPELLPRYLQRLAAEQAFAGTEFRNFQMDAVEHGRGVRFMLSTEAGD